MKAMKFWNIAIPVAASLAIAVPPVALYVPQAIKIVPFEMEYELPEGVSFTNNDAKIGETFTTKIVVPTTDTEIIGVRIHSDNLVLGPDCYFLDYETGTLTIKGQYITTTNMTIEVMVREKQQNEPLHITAITNNTLVSFEKWWNDEYMEVDLEMTKTPNVEKSWEKLDVNPTGEGGPMPSIVLQAGETVYFRGNNPNGFNDLYFDNHSNDADAWCATDFTCDYGRIKVGGDIMSLLSTDGSITTMPNYGCFYCLFTRCYGLVDASELILPDDIIDYCYEYMFSEDNNLQAGPALPSEQTARGCYTTMFGSCENMVKAPDLPAKVLTQDCYSNMFDGCSSLNEIRLGYEGTLSSNYMYDWVDEVAESGTLYYTAPPLSIIPFGPSGCPNGWTIKPYI